MATDDERRRVAERLRGLTCIPLVQNVLGLEYDEKMPNSWLWFTSQSVNHLADLIEPDTAKAPKSSDTTPNSHQNCGTRKASASQVPECDREALLALARWLDARATDLLKTNSIDHSRRRTSARREHAMDLMTACGLIREACGEVA